jgi:hypothetical protein
MRNLKNFVQDVLVFVLYGLLIGAAFEGCLTLMSVLYTHNKTLALVCVAIEAAAAIGACVKKRCDKESQRRQRRAEALRAAKMI